MWDWAERSAWRWPTACNIGINGSPCSPSSSCQIPCVTPLSSVHKYDDKFPWNCKTKRSAELPLLHWSQTFKHCMPLTPPDGFCSTVNRPRRNTSTISSSTTALELSCANRQNRVVSSTSRNGRKWSVMPDGPPAAPRLATLKFFANLSSSRTNDKQKTTTNRSINSFEFNHSTEVCATIVATSRTTSTPSLPPGYSLATRALSLNMVNSASESTLSTPSSCPAANHNVTVANSGHQRATFPLSTRPWFFAQFLL